MAIVFEEVTGEIVPERSAIEAAPRESQPAGAGTTAETVRRELQLLRERERRLKAD